MADELILHPLVRCQHEPYLREMKTTVVRCSKSEGVPEAKGKIESKKKKKGKNKKKEAETAPSFDLVLKETILFPEGGGQPFDLGTVGDAAVSHVSHNASGAVVHVCSKELKAGDEVSVRVDWTRRYDHMQQHTGQHLISAVFKNKKQWNTASWWLASYPQPCYIEFDAKEITDAELCELEREVNDIIMAARPIRVHVFSSVEECKQHPHYQAHPEAVPSALKCTMRVIEIEQVDWNKCCGTHLRNTAELQLVKFSGQKKEKGGTKVFFYAGGRTSFAMSDLLSFQRTMVGVTKTAADKLPAMVTGFMERNRQLAKDCDTLTTKVAELTAASLLRTLSPPSSALAPAAAAADPAATAAKTPPILVWSEPGASSAMLSALNAALLAGVEASPGRQRCVWLLSGTDTDEKSAAGVFFLSGFGVEPALVKRMGTAVAKLFDGRGGGKPGVYQGKGAQVATNLDKVEDVLKQA